MGRRQRRQRRVWEGEGRASVPSPAPHHPLPRGPCFGGPRPPAQGGGGGLGGGHPPTNADRGIIASRKDSECVAHFYEHEEALRDQLLTGVTPRLAGPPRCSSESRASHPRSARRWSALTPSRTRRAGRVRAAALPADRRSVAKGGRPRLPGLLRGGRQRQDGPAGRPAGATPQRLRGGLTRSGRPATRGIRHPSLASRTLLAGPRGHGQGDVTLDSETWP